MEQTFEDKTNMFGLFSFCHSWSSEDRIRRTHKITQPDTDTADQYTFFDEGDVQMISQ